MANYLFCDTETGGLESGQPILEMAWHVTNDKNELLTSQQFYFEVADWSNVSEQAIEINGLTPEVLDGKLLQQGSSFPVEVVTDWMICDMRDYQASFVAYNSPFDVRMILAQLPDYADLKDGIDQVSAYAHLINHIDVMEPAKKYISAKHWLSLVNAYREIVGKPPRADAHTADADILMTRELFFKLKKLKAI